MRGPTINGKIKNAPDPTTRFTPGFIRRLISRTSLVARAMISPMDWRS